MVEPCPEGSAYRDDALNTFQQYLGYLPFKRWIRFSQIVRA